MTAALLDHLWQSSLLAAAIALMMPLFRRQPAALRFWLWFAASMKFLLPFAALVWLGEHLLAPEAPAPVLYAIRPLAPSLQRAAPLLAPAPAGFAVLDVALVIWIAGIAILALVALSRWLDLRAVLKEAEPLASSLPVPLKLAPSFVEPGLVGIWRPVILLPKGLAQQLAGPELEAILAHELCHLRRRDNLLAALHMLVEGLFWFHPLIWWLSARLMEERERACDEAVLSGGARPRDYAEGILKTCRFYVQSPLSCAAGVSGALEMRLGAIMTSRPAVRLSRRKTLLLAALGLSALLLPLITGLMGSAPVLHLVVRTKTVLALPVPMAAIPAPSPRPAIRFHRLHARAPRPVPQAALARPEPYHVVAPAPALTAVLEVKPPALPMTEAAAVQTERVCRPPQRLPASRLMGPEICLTAVQWAALKARHQDVGPDGRVLIATDYDKQKALQGHRCDVSLPFTASAGWNAGMPNCF